jgi:hypothetical protein
VLLYVVQFGIWSSISVNSFLYYSEATTNNIRSKYWFAASSIMIYTVLARTLYLYMPDTIIANSVNIAMVIAAIMTAQVFLSTIKRKAELTFYMMLWAVAIIGMADTPGLYFAHSVIYLVILYLIFTNEVFSSWEIKINFIFAYALLFVLSLLCLVGFNYKEENYDIFTSLINIAAGLLLSFSIKKASTSGSY